MKRRYYRWIEMGVLDEMLSVLAREADLEWGRNKRSAKSMGWKAPAPPVLEWHRLGWTNRERSNGRDVILRRRVTPSTPGITKSYCRFRRGDPVLIYIASLTQFSKHM